MNKKLLFILFLLLCLPLFAKAEVCETEKVTIDSFEVIKTEGNAKEKKAPKVEGKNIQLYLKMSEIEDFISYRFVVKNTSKSDFEFDPKSLNIDSNYFDYTVESKDSSNIIKANTSKEFTLNIKYKTEVPEELFKNGAYQDTNAISMDLSSNNTIENPSTGIPKYLLILLLGIIVLGSLYLTSLENNKAKNLSLLFLVFGLSLIPTSIYALCKCELKIDSMIEITHYPTFCYINEGNTYYYEYAPNMQTWNDYILSDLNEDFQISKHNEIQPKNYEHLDYCNSLKMNSDYAENEDPIISSEQACYTFETPTGFCK